MSGVATPVRDLEGHVGLVCPSDQVRDQAVADFVSGGLQLGEHVVLATDDPGLASALVQRGVDTRRWEDDGLLTTLGASAFYPTGGQRGVLDSTLGSGRPGARVVAFAQEAIAHLGDSGFRRAERQMDDVCRAHPVTLLCLLRSSTAMGEPLSPILDTFVDTHAQQLRAPGLAVQRTAEGARLSGELDINGSALVETAMGAAGDGVAGGPPGHDVPLVVDLSALDFLDVAGYRAILRGTQRWRGQGGTVLLTRAGAMVRKLVALWGPGADGHVRLD